ncbi:MAG: ATP-binding protein [Candidatus Lustribacter sp.]|jgi:adenylate kinase family enzyme
MTEAAIRLRRPVDAFAAYAVGVLRNAIDRATERRGHAFDPVRSLYVADAEAFEILAAGLSAQPLVGAGEPPAEAMPAPLRVLPRFEIATVALLAGLSMIPRVERVIGFLHDDLTRRSVTPGLLLDLFADGLDERARALDALAADGLLARLAILELARDEAPLLAPVHINASFLSRLRGSGALDRKLVPFAARGTAAEGVPRGNVHPAADVPTILWGAEADALAAAARDCAALHQVPLLRVASETPAELYGVAAREALFDGALLSIATSTPHEALQAARALLGLPVVALVEAPAGIAALDEFKHQRVDQTARRAEQASIAQPLPYGRRLVARRGLERLVLPAAKLRALRSISARIKHRETVIDDWGLDTGSSAGGIRCLFSGPPGTGKTLAAEAIAAQLERDLYIIDISTVVSKYIGETEKILSKVFADAARAKVCLFFDEADALFGKRGEQKDAHDKYANVETAYLLQAIDAYPDLVVLATNMRNNLDDALSRRIDVFVDFPMPDVGARRRLWKIALARAPHDPGDIERVAQSFALSGGGIQNAALAAAYDAAAEARSIMLVDLLRAARDEFAKSGKVAGRVELGDQYAVLAGDA